MLIMKHQTLSIRNCHAFSLTTIGSFNKHDTPDGRLIKREGLVHGQDE